MRSQDMGESRKHLWESDHHLVGWGWGLCLLLSGLHPSTACSCALVAPTTLAVLICLCKSRHRQTVNGFRNLRTLQYSKPCV